MSRFYFCHLIFLWKITLLNSYVVDAVVFHCSKSYSFFPTLSEEGGVRQGDLVNWYLKEIEGEIETVQELTDKKLLVEKVIDRLVHHVSHMISVEVT